MNVGTDYEKMNLGKLPEGRVKSYLEQGMNKGIIGINVTFNHPFPGMGKTGLTHLRETEMGWQALARDDTFSFINTDKQLRGSSTKCLSTDTRTF